MKSAHEVPQIISEPLPELCGTRLVLDAAGIWADSSVTPRILFRDERGDENFVFLTADEGEKL